MNCKQDDLAFVIRSKWGNVGKIVRCVKFHPVFKVQYQDGRVERCTNGWEIEPRLSSFGGPEKCRIVGDELLRPIRDPGDSAIDQIVQLVGVAPMTLTEVLERSGA
jgi:hypothetical protein